MATARSLGDAVPFPPSGEKTTDLIATADRRLLVQITRNPGYTVFRHVGCFTEREKLAIAQVNEAVVNIRGKTAVIDMTDSMLIDAYGLGNLLVLHGAMAIRRKTLVVVIDGQSTPLGRLRASGVTDVIPIYASLAECVAALKCP